MVEDYALRKLAKKHRKREGADERGKRVRTKKNKTRRICRGQCYKEPFAVRRPGQTLADVDREVNAPDDDEEAAAPKAKRRRKADPKKDSVKQSTSTNLLHTSKTHSSNAAPQAAAAAPLSEALAAFPHSIQQFMQDHGLTGLTPIQERSWPVCLAGQDVQAVAEPGSGKTLGYLLPAVPLLQEQAALRQSGDATGYPVMLVLAPTRELAQQIAMTAKPLKRMFGLASVCVYGGVDKQQQVDLLKQQPSILIATPGRLLDLVDDQDCDLTLEHVKYLVLDEADKMLSLGLQPQLKRIRVLAIPKKRKAEEGAGVLAKSPKKQKRPQVLMFTATMPETLQATAAKWQRKPVKIVVAPGDMSISESIMQIVQVCAEHKKPAKLLKHLNQIKDASKGQRIAPKILIFANRIKTVRFIHQNISEAGFKAAQLHGDRSQQEREAAMLSWKAGQSQILVATDVAARGLHIKSLPYVINYDFPTNLDTYVHRVGRTGRLATDGHAYSFLTRNLAPIAKPLLDLLKVHNQAVDPNLVLLADAYTVAAQKMTAAGTGSASD